MARSMPTAEELTLEVQGVQATLIVEPDGRNARITIGTEYMEITPDEARAVGAALLRIARWQADAANAPCAATQAYGATGCT